MLKESGFCFFSVISPFLLNLKQQNHAGASKGVTWRQRRHRGAVGKALRVVFLSLKDSCCARNVLFNIVLMKREGTCGDGMLVEIRACFICLPRRCFASELILWLLLHLSWVKVMGSQWGWKIEVFFPQSGSNSYTLVQQQ